MGSVKLDLIIYLQGIFSILLQKPPADSDQSVKTDALILGTILLGSSRGFWTGSASLVRELALGIEGSYWVRLVTQHPLQGLQDPLE
jgi:hypothetical protein